MPKHKEGYRTAAISAIDPKSTRKWTVFEADSEDQAINYMGGVVPSVHVVNGITRVLRGVEVTQLARRTYEVKATYERTPNTYSLSIDFTGGTKKVTEALETKEVYDATGGMIPIPEFNNSINVSSSGVEGVEIEDARFEIQINAHLELSVMPMDYLDTLWTMTPSINDAPYELMWLGQRMLCDKGELKFRGINVKQGGDYSLDITYYLSRRRGLTAAENFFVTGPDAEQTVPIESEGWDVLWTYYEEAHDAAASRTVRVPLAVIKQRVFHYADFGELKLYPTEEGQIAEGEDEGEE